MIANLFRLPRWGYGLFIIICVIGEIFLLFQTDTLTVDVRPVADLPARFWLYTFLELLLLFVLVVSVNLFMRPTRPWASLFAKAGIGVLIIFAFQLFRPEWTGN